MLKKFDDPLLLRSGKQLPQYSLNFETYGTLASTCDNAILVCHSLTGNAHAAGEGGWWDKAIGPGRMLDTDEYFVVCSDTLASGTSTGPASIDPTTGRPYGPRFPVVTVQDMVAAQRRLVETLGIDRLRAVIGGCFGGQQALEWAIGQADAVRDVVVITATAATSAHTIAVFSVMRHLIRADPAWKEGDYYGGTFPAAGLNAAVATGVPLWMSRDAMEERFGRRTAPEGGYQYTLEPEFEVEAFIDQITSQPRPTLDPNGLMYRMRAEEYYDLERDYGGVEQAFAKVTARVMFVSYDSDWRFPPAEIEAMHSALAAVGGRSRHVRLDSPLAHGAFIREIGGLAPAVVEFLSEGDDR